MERPDKSSSPAITDFLTASKTILSEIEPRREMPDPISSNRSSDAVNCNPDLAKILGNFAIDKSSRLPDCNANSLDEAKEKFLKEAPVLSDKELAMSAAKVAHYLKRDGSFSSDYRREQISSEFRRAAEANCAEKLVEKINAELANEGYGYRLELRLGELESKVIPAHRVSWSPKDTDLLVYSNFPEQFAIKRSVELTMRDVNSNVTEDMLSLAVEKTYSSTSRWPFQNPGLLPGVQFEQKNDGGLNRPLILFDEVWNGRCF